MSEKFLLGVSFLIESKPFYPFRFSHILKYQIENMFDNLTNYIKFDKQMNYIYTDRLNHSPPPPLHSFLLFYIDWSQS